MKKNKPEIQITAAQIARESNIKDSADFVLRNSGKYPAELLKSAAVHLEFYQKLKKKIPSWAEIPGLITHEAVNLEQASSEHTARYKAGFAFGKSGLDLSGGLGIDSYFLSNNFENFHHNEPDIDLSETVKYNFKILGKKNVDFTHFPAEDFPFTEKWDWIYLDPSRRDGNKRIQSLRDYKPNIVILKERLLSFGRNVMIKLSPMLDIKSMAKELDVLTEVWVLAENNEVKELVLILNKNANCVFPIKCVNLNSGQPEFTFDFEEEKNAKIEFGEPGSYLFEPNASILKAGAFNIIAERYPLKKLAKNSHLYFSDDIIEDFPGRIFRIKETLNYDKKKLNKRVEGKMAHISCRNFPINPEKIKKELGWKDGGEDYLFFTEDSDKNKIVLITEKINL